MQRRLPERYSGNGGRGGERRGRDRGGDGGFRPGCRRSRGRDELLWFQGRHRDRVPAIRLEGEAYHLGVLVLANFGRAGDLRLPDGRRVDPSGGRVPETGSVAVIIATDIPLDHRQLGRVARRAGAGIAWCGSFWGNGSGDIALAFTTANRVPHEAGEEFLSHRVLAESRIDRLFQAAAEGTQEAVLDALAAAETTTGRHGHRRVGLAELLLAQPEGRLRWATCSPSTAAQEPSGRRR